MKILERLKKIREGLRISVVQHSVYDIARFNNLAIEYLEGMPAKFDAHLDTDENPRFIAVNPELPKPEQVYVIAREIARYAQLRQWDSLLINRPWKWTLLANAPAETRAKICRTDVELRTHCLVTIFISRDDFRALFKSHLKKSLLIGSVHHAIADLCFLKLRIKSFLNSLYRPFTIAFS